MHSRLIRRRPATIAVAVILAIGALATIAVALPPTSTQGSAQLRMDNRADTAPQSTDSVSWVNLIGSEIPVTVPAGRRLLVNARFTGETRCFGPTNRYCRARIVAVDPAGVPVELQPVSGLDFRFDSANPAPLGYDDDIEAHAMERSRHLDRPGTWQVGVQYSVSYASGLFTLDDWHHAVETTATP